MSHWIILSTIKLRQRQPIWSTFGQVAKWWDAWRYKGNSKVGTQWDYVTYLFFFYTNCIISIFRRCSLTRTSTSCTKTPITGQLQNQYNSFSQRNFKLFSFFCFVLQECPMVHFLYMHLTIIAAHKYLHAKQKTITRNSRNRGKKEMFDPYSCSIHQVQG